MASGWSAWISSPRIPASSIDGSASTRHATLSGPNSPGSPTRPTVRPVGGLPEGARPTSRRSFLVGAGAAAGLLAMGCSTTDGPTRAAAGTTTTAAARGGSKYLQGPYAPVSEELTLPDLEVTGRLPAELDGLYLRNGPNPWPVPEGRYDWFTGDGMVHGVALGDGRARWY